jgi:hypothetical protein
MPFLKPDHAPLSSTRITGLETVNVVQDAQNYTTLARVSIRGWRSPRLVLAVCCQYCRWVSGVCMLAAHPISDLVRVRFRPPRRLLSRCSKWRDASRVALSGTLPQRHRPSEPVGAELQLAPRIVKRDAYGNLGSLILRQYLAFGFARATLAGMS